MFDNSGNQIDQQNQTIGDYVKAVNYYDGTDIDIVKRIYSLAKESFIPSDDNIESFREMKTVLLDFLRLNPPIYTSSLKNITKNYQISAQVAEDEIGGDYEQQLKTVKKDYYSYCEEEMENLLQKNNFQGAENALRIASELKKLDPIYSWETERVDNMAQKYFDTLIDQKPHRYMSSKDSS